jgi:hypothetical protein
VAASYVELHRCTCDAPPSRARRSARRPGADSPGPMAEPPAAAPKPCCVCAAPDGKHCAKCKSCHYCSKALGKENAAQVMCNVIKITGCPVPEDHV